MMVADENDLQRHVADRFLNRYEWKLSSSAKASSTKILIRITDTSFVKSSE